MRLQQSAVCQGRRFTVTDDEVIQQADIDELQRRFEPPCDVLVSLTGLGDARGVIVSDNHYTRSIASKDVQV